MILTFSICSVQRIVAYFRTTNAKQRECLPFILYLRCVMLRDMEDDDYLYIYAQLGEITFNIYVEITGW